jgi:Fe(3+) dicitrate transport protein
MRAVCVLAAVAHPRGLAAQSTRTPLPAVVVVGSRPGSSAGIPGATSVVDSVRLARLAPLSVKEALRTVPGVHVVDEDAFGLNLNIGVRGLPPRRAQRVLLLEDGMPIHLGPYSDPSAHYHPPADALERIEVVKGSAQIAFGPQTVGGVINFVRRAPPVQPTARLALSGGSRALATGRVFAGGTWRGVGLSLDAARREGNGTRDGQHHRVDDLSLRAVVPVGETQRIAITAGAYREASRYGEAGLSQEEFERDPFQNPLPNDVFDLTRQALQAVHEVRLGRATLRTQAYGQRLERTAWRQGSTSADRLGNAAYERNFRCVTGATTVNQCGNTGRPRAYDFIGLEPRLTLPHTLFGARGTLESGVRVHEEHMRRQEIAGNGPSARSGTLTRDNAIDTRATAGFLREQLQAGRFLITPGVRVEQVRSTNTNRLLGNSGDAAYTEVLPGLGLSWTPPIPSGHTLSLLGGVHRGFAPPRPADVLNPVVGEGIVQVDAETNWTSELGARLALRDVATVEVTAFRLDYDNQVVSGALVGSGQRFVNAGRTLHAGVEVSTSFALQRLLGARVWPPRRGALTGEVAWLYAPTARFANDRASTVDARQSVLGRRLPFAPRHVLNAGLGWSTLRGASLRVDGDAVSAQFADDLNTVLPAAQGRRGLLPSYVVVNASLRVPMRTGRTGTVVTAGIKNIANRVYITDRQEGIMTGMPRLVTMGMEIARQ